MYTPICIAINVSTSLHVGTFVPKYVFIFLYVFVFLYVFIVLYECVVACVRVFEEMNSCVHLRRSITQIELKRL